MVIFAPQNVIKDPPFTKLDFVSCRNLMIYMELELQKKLIALFNYSLRPGGIMLLGTSETPGNLKDNFNLVDIKLKIFKRSFTKAELINFPSSFHHHKSMIIENNVPIKVADNIQTITDQIILQRFAPACVLVTDKGDIVYITGRTGKYLEPVAGKANWNIHAMAREGLSQELPGAFRKVMQTYEAVVLPNIKVGTNGGTQYVDVILQRLDSPQAVKNMVVVVFNDVIPIIQGDTNNSKTNSPKHSSFYKKMELELQRSHEEMQSMREEMQTSQEELKSTNEELQSTNEELQSTNEELTTSKEEMQSLNEELQTVNIELQSKVNDFVQANNDMKNLLNSTEIATLFLDKELNIRRFTESVTTLFKLRHSDIGRPFTDLATELQYPEIDNHSHQVLKTLATIETSIITNDNRWFSVRIMPYRTLEDRIEGLVITFSDITQYKLLELELKKANDILLKNNK